ncbi:hypothetical protein [Campylobacter californiensis]|uniref:hypothetical protein n=1 Tax=Campylobacter californiensis TaxID=1032243 RepID=UPI0014729E27|nr:hypothetical protein [Campylobacter sp. RM12916]MBE3609545.1 hypothetical protein [Campylobacter sp. RM12916]
MQISLFAQNFVIKNDQILSDMVVQKIEIIGTELKQKSGVSLFLAAYETFGERGIYDEFRSLNLKSPYAVLILGKNEHKVEIYADEETLKLFDKERILSPYPERGTILPILTSKNGKDIFNAALLNGYADIAEGIAASQNITLENSIGNANKTTLNFIRLLVYGSMAFVVVFIIYRKRAKRG